MFLALAAFPSTALGATAFVVDEDGNGQLHYVAAPGEVNQVQQTQVETQTHFPDVTIHDSGAVIVAGEGCTQVDDHEVNCSDIEITQIGLGDLGDTAAIHGGYTIVDAGGGNDELTACSTCHDAEFSGRGGNDVITGNGYSLTGQGGNDTITGGRSGQFIYGGAGDDVIDGRGGRDYTGPGSGDDTVDAGAGRDTLTFLERGSHGVVVNLRTGVATGQGSDTLLRAENVLGTRSDDRLIGDSQANNLLAYQGYDILIGGGGDDVIDESYAGEDRILGGRGNDKLNGGSRDDVLVGGPGRDSLRGGGGDDRLRTKDGFADTLSGGDGDDWARVDRRDDVHRVERFG